MQEPPKDILKLIDEADQQRESLRAKKGRSSFLKGVFSWVGMIALILLCVSIFSDDGEEYKKGVLRGRYEALARLVECQSVKESSVLSAYQQARNTQVKLGMPANYVYKCGE